MLKLRRLVDFYINTGDFVESDTAIVEHFNGTLELVKWKKIESAINDQESLEVNFHR
jgi:hypothetical protein